MSQPVKITVSSDGTQETVRNIDGVSAATGRLSATQKSLTATMKAAAAALGAYKLYDLIKDSALLAARYETLGVVMGVVGNTAGYTSRQMQEFEKSLQRQGIAMVESRSTLTKMAQAHIDLTKASELARIAQDAAVIGNTNSSAAFESMINGIQRGEVEILKTIGINVNFEQSYAKLAAQLGKNAGELTEVEKVQARTNSVMEKGKDIAGVYDAAMGTAGKQLNSVKRYTDNLKVSLGSVFNEALFIAVDGFSGGLKKANAEAEELQRDGKIKQWGRESISIIAMLADVFLNLLTPIKVVTSTIIAGALQISEFAQAANSLMTGEFGAARDHVVQLMAIGDEWGDQMKKIWDTGVITKFSDAAQAAFKKMDKPTDPRLEKNRMAAGKANATDQQEKDALLRFKKESELAEKLLNLQQTKAEKTLAIERVAISNALGMLDYYHEQGKVSTAAYLEQKYELEKVGVERSIANAQAEMDGQKAIYEKLKANKFTSPETLIAYEQKYAASKKAWQMESLELTTLENKALIERMRLLGEESQRIATNNILQDQFGLRQQQIDQMKIQGMELEAFEKQKILDLEKLKFDFAEKMLDYQRQLNNATEAQAELIRQNIRMYTDLGNAAQEAVSSRVYTAPTAASDNMSSDINSGGTIQNFSFSYTTNVNNEAQNSNVHNEALRAAEDAARAWEAAQVAARAMADDLSVRYLDVQGLKEEAAILKLQIAQQNELNKAQQDGLDTAALLTVQQMEYNKLLHEQNLAKVIKDTEKFFDTVKKSISELTSTGNNLVSSLRSAALALSSAGEGLLMGSPTTLSPEQQYEKSRQTLAAAVQQAISTGDAGLYGQIPGMVSSFLEQSQNYNASNSQFGSDFSWAQDLLSGSALAAAQAADQAESVISAAEKQQATLDAIKAALTTDNTAALPKLLAELESDTGTLNSAVTATNLALSNSGAIAQRFTTSFAADSPLVKGINTPAIVSAVGTSATSITGAVNTNTGAVTGAVNTGTGAVTGAVFNNATNITGTLGVINHTTGTIGVNATANAATISSAVSANATAVTSAANVNAASVTGSIGTLNTTTGGIASAVDNSATTVSTAVGASATTLTGSIGTLNTTTGGIASAVDTSATTITTSIGNNATTLTSSVGVLNTTTGGISSAVNDNATTVTGSLSVLNATTGSGLTGSGSVREALTTTVVDWLESINTSSLGLKTPLNTVSAYTGETVNRLAGGSTSAGNLLSAINAKTRLIEKVTTLNLYGSNGWGGYYTSPGPSGATTGNTGVQNPTGSQTVYAYQPAAKGGYRQGWTLVGEEGPELVNFTQPGRVYTAEQTSRALSGDNTETLAELRQQNRLLTAQIRVLQAGFSALLSGQQEGNKSLKTVESGTTLQKRAA